jgi:hypothetical protein
MPIDWNAFLDKLVLIYRPYLLTLLGLMLADVALGIAVGLKSRTFAWSRVADFYRCTVAPGLLGWVGLTIATYLVVPTLLNPYQDLISQAVCTLAWAAVVASLAASLGKSLQELYGFQLKLPFGLGGRATVEPARPPDPPSAAPDAGSPGTPAASGPGSC